MAGSRRKSGTNVAKRQGVEGRLRPASQGVGPLLERDYWAVLPGCPKKPSELITFIREHFCEFPPRSLLNFVTSGAIELGAHLDIQILPGQQCAVKVVHADDQSFTLGTLEGHPEAGRITFGAYRNSAGEVILHIRSRARSADTPTRLGFLAIGDAMQTNTWTDFIVNVAAKVGSPIKDVIHADTNEVEPVPEDDDPLDSPTFLAVGD
jgi:hypothetical protein